MDDVALLRQYVEDGSQEAFAELVRRHVGLVYSSALRQTRDPHLAEDLTQAAFIALARGAHKLGRDQLLCGWLMTTTRYLVLNALKSASRRKRHERRAAEMAAMTSDPQTQDAWDARNQRRRFQASPRLPWPLLPISEGMTKPTPGTSTPRRYTARPPAHRKSQPTRFRRGTVAAERRMNVAHGASHGSA